MKLELGSGDRPTPGYVHLDVREDAPDVDIVGDAENLLSVHARSLRRGIRLDSCEEIRATHLLEHFSHQDTVSILKHWRDYLAPGGLLYLEVPNLTAHVNAWKWGQSTDEQFIVYLYGEQDHEHNQHRTAFTQESLRAALEQAGYVDVEMRDVGLVLVGTGRRGER